MVKFVDQLLDQRGRMTEPVIGITGLPDPGLTPDAGVSPEISSDTSTAILRPLGRTGWSPRGF